MGKDWTGNKNSVFKTLGASNHTDKERQSEDFYATSPDAIDRLLDVIDIPFYVYEPCCGAGHLSKRLEDLGHPTYSTDLVYRGYGEGGIDFLKLRGMPFDEDCCILTNPPYKCYDADTECFTKRGWLRYDQLNTSDEILSLNPKNQMLEWSQINSIIIRDIDKNEKMFHFHKRHLDIMVTNGHRMFCFDKANDILATKCNDLVKSEDIRSIHYIPRKGYKWVGVDVDYFVLPAINGTSYAQPTFKDEIKIPMNDWLDFFGLWLADGYCRHTLNSQGNKRKTVGIKQMSANGNRIRKALDKLPFVYKESRDTYNRGNECINFEINNEQLWCYLVQFGKSHEKYIPRQIKELPQTKLRVLLNSYMDGDGSKIDNGFIYRSVSRGLIEDIQEILLKLGYMSHIVSTSYTTQKGETRTLYSIHAAYESLYNKIFFPSNKNEQCETYYQGKVWCVNLKKNGVFFLRRNGCEFFCGNCATDIIEHAIEIAPYDDMPIFMLLKTTALEGKGRWERLYSKGYLHAVFQFRERLLCAKNGDFEGMMRGGGSAVSYMWALFSRSKCDAPKIYWI